FVLLRYLAVGVEAAALIGEQAASVLFYRRATQKMISDGYTPLPPDTYSANALLRSNLKSHGDADVAASIAYGKRVAIYPFSGQTILLKRSDLSLKPAFWPRERALKSPSCNREIRALAAKVSMPRLPTDLRALPSPWRCGHIFQPLCE